MCVNYRNDGSGTVPLVLAMDLCVIIALVVQKAGYLAGRFLTGAAEYWAATATCLHQIFEVVFLPFLVCSCDFRDYCAYRSVPYIVLLSGVFLTHT